MPSPVAFGLGDLFDIGHAFGPVDLDTNNGATGARIHMGKWGAVGVLLKIGAAASGTDTVTIDAQQHTAYTSGTSADLDAAAVSDSVGITEYWYKRETTLDNDEAWVRVAQSEASEITLTGSTWAALEKMIYFRVGSDQLGDGYTHFSVNVAVTTSAVQLATGIYLPLGLRVARTPANLPNLLRPGAANA